MSDATGRPSHGAELHRRINQDDAKREKQRDLRPLASLWPLVRRHWSDALLSASFLILSTAATLSLTGAARVVVNRGFASEGAAEQLNRSFLLLGAVALVLALATALRFYFVTKLGERVVLELRKALYRHVLGLDQAFFLKMRTGEILSRMTTDIGMVENLVGANASLALRNLLSATGALVLMLFVSPRLTLYVLLLLPLVLAPLFVFGRRVRRLSVTAQDRFADAVAYAGETLDALDTVQAFGRERSAGDRFARAADAAFEASRARIRVRAGMTAMAIALIFGGVALVLWLGAHSVLDRTMSPGALVQFVFLAVLAAGAFGVLGEVWGEVQKAAGAMQRISEILASKPEIAAPARPTPLPTPPRGEVAFENVTFHYPGRDDLPALENFSLQVRPGERVALVGPSGAGKSTVLRLLLRFYDPQSGAVRVDGVDLREADPAEARARMALVAQDAGLFSGSAADNIRFGREDASPEEVRAAALAAQAAGFLAALPQGSDSEIGERARTLSGGQRQRLALARALIRDAPILLLDEATSALDAENERLVQRALDQAMEGRTTLVIAHRLATVLRADRIVVMDAGRVVEEGRHGQLIAQGGLYARLAELQFGGEAA
ncbi:MAG TPA: ABC transporter transmembrane domain-containing protein [Caulobacteraceae bacterium]